jgi:cysteine desulfurase
LPQNINIAFLHKSSDSLVIAADLAGLAISAGSACHSGATQESYVIQAISPTNIGRSRKSIRISLSQYTTQEEIEEAYHIIQSIV